MATQGNEGPADTYALSIWAAGEFPQIPINAERHALIADAEATQQALLQIEEKFELVITNYEELETELASLTVRHMIRRDLPWQRMSADRLMLNRRLANLLSTCRLYTEQVTQDLTAPPIGLDLAATKQLFSQQYDASLGFRVMEALRNQMQHRSIPATRISYASTSEGKLTAWRINLGLDIEMLRAGGFKRATLSELKALEADKVDLILFVREYVQGLAAVQDSIREATRDKGAHSDKAMSDALAEWNATGQAPTGLAAIKMTHDGEWSDELYIGTNLRDRREELARANRTMSMLSRRYITSARPLKAYV